MKQINLPNATDPRVITLLERLVASVEGLREDLRQDLGSFVEASRAASNARDAVEPNSAAITERDPLQLLTADEVAALLQVDARTLREMRAAGEAPPSISVGRRPRWVRRDVDDWIAQRRSP